MTGSVPPLSILLVLAWSFVGGLGAASANGESPFREVTEEWGVTFRHHHGGSGERYMVESVAGGAVLFDYDDDGDVDLFFVDGGALPGYEGEPPRSRLFRNEGPGRFVDVTDGSGIRVGSYGMGGTAGDVDGDGDLDLYVTQLGANQLFENLGDGTFRDVTAEAGVGDPRFSASAAFSDVDGDGNLDLYVTNYVGFTVADHKDCSDPEKGVPGYCHPDAYPPLRDTFYRNRGDGTFADETEAAGLGGAIGPGLGVAFADLDLDGFDELYVANDAQPNFLFRNRGDGTFEDVSLLSGTAYGPRSTPEGGMGVAVGDVDGNGLEDLAVTNFEFEGNALYLNRGELLFQEARFRAQIAEVSLPLLAFGVVLADFDLDGDLDLAVGNGHIQDNAPLHEPSSRYAQEDQLFWNRGDGVFELVPDPGLGGPTVTRALAAGDLDGDGDLDLVAVRTDDRAGVYENLAEGSWLEIDVRRTSGATEVGARLEVGGSVRQIRTGSSYLAQGQTPVSFGLGSGDGVERGPHGDVKLVIPGGGTTVVRSPGLVDRRVRFVLADQPSAPNRSRAAARSLCAEAGSPRCSSVSAAMW